MTIEPKQCDHSAADPMTLGDVIIAVKNCRKLSETQRRDIVSAVTRVAAWLGLPPENLPADRPQLRRRLDALDVGNIRAKSGERLSKGRIQNVRSSLHKALDVAGLPQVRRIKQISPKWRAIKEAAGSVADGYALSKFGRWCTPQAIEPENVDEAISEQYRIDLENGSLVKKPREKHQQLCRAWNRIVDAGCLSGLSRLTVPKYRDGYGLPRNAFALSFRNDVAAYIAYLQNKDVLADDAPAKPVRPATAKVREKQLYSAASALHHRGIPLDDIVDLAFLSQPHNVRSILEFYLARHNGQKTKMLSDMAEGLFKVAFRWVKAEKAILDELRVLKKRTSKKQFGMTDKNRAVLRRFNNTELAVEFKHLPPAIMEEIDAKLEMARKRGRNNVPYRLAVEYQKAVAAMILQMAPMRAKNLAALHLERHLNWGVSRNKLVITIAGDEVKNEEPLSFELPEAATKRIRRYIDVYRPALLRGVNGHLFPGEAGRAKSENNLSQQLARLVSDRLGVRLTCHQFRHVMGKIYLDANPGQYEVVRRVLGHKSIETTVAYYAGEETVSALRHYHRGVFGHDETGAGK